MACGNALEVVDSVKLLGVTITSNLTWNLHVAEVIKKASRRFYFLLQLKRAHVPKSDLVTFYTSCDRSVSDYAVQVFHSSPPLYLINDLERVQKRALSSYYQSIIYNEALVQAVQAVQAGLSRSLRNPRTFNIKCNTKRANNTFFNHNAIL